MGFAHLLATNPETFELLAKNDITLFHGTNANALPNILKYGLRSTVDLDKQGIEVTTGEQTKLEGMRSFISFTDDLDTALDYASLSPSNSEEKTGGTSFGVLIGISSDIKEQVKTCRVKTPLPEIGFTENISLENIKMLAVPKDKVDFVRKLVNDDQITIAPINIDERFYDIDLNSGIPFFDTEKAKELIDKKEQAEPEVKFDSHEISDFVGKRKTPGIFNIYKKLKDRLQGKIMIKGNDKENGTRN